jgi:hypothetical protein
MGTYTFLPMPKRVVPTRVVPTRFLPACVCLCVHACGCHVFDALEDLGVWAVKWLPRASGVSQSESAKCVHYESWFPRSELWVYTHNVGVLQQCGSTPI